MRQDGPMRPKRVMRGGVAIALVVAGWITAVVATPSAAGRRGRPAR